MKVFNYIACLKSVTKYIVALWLCMCAFALRAQVPEPLALPSDTLVVQPMAKSMAMPTDSIVGAFSSSLDSIATTSMLIDSTAVVVDTIAGKVNVSTFDPSYNNIYI